jgi:hypothetical protein
MFSFSNDELGKKKEVHEGDTFLHEECGQLHELIAAVNVTTGEKDDSVMHFKCGEKSILGALNHRFLL